MKRSMTMIMVCWTCAVMTAYVNAADTEKTRMWTSVTGQSVDAEYVSIQSEEVVLRKPDGDMISIDARSLSAADRAWIEQEEARRNPPAGVRPPAQPYRLPVFDGGEGDGYYAVYTARNFDAMINARGELFFHPKVNGERVGEPMMLHMDSFMRDNAVRPISVIDYQEYPAPTRQPTSLRLSGLLRREVPFDMTYEFSEAGIKAYGTCQDPRGLEPPTVYRLRLKIPPTHSVGNFSSAEQQRELLKDWEMKVTPVSGRQQSFKYWESLGGVIIGGQAKDITLDIPLYGGKKILLRSGNPNIAFLLATNYDGKSLWQGVSVVCSKDENNPRTGVLQYEITIE